MSKSKTPHDQVKTPWGGLGSGKDGRPNPIVMLRRLALVIVIVVFPLGALLAAPLALLLTRQPVMQRVRGWWVAAAGVLLTGGALAWLGLARYFTPWREVIEHINLGTGPGDGGLAQLAADRWTTWVTDQWIPSVGVGMVVAGVVAWRKWRYNPEQWRASQTEAGQEWDALTDRQVTRAHARVEDEKEPAAANTAGTAFADLTMRVGINEKGRAVRLRGEHFRAHLVAITPTGFGKTETLLRITEGWLVDWRARRLPYVLFDLKGDPDVLAAIKGMCAHADRMLTVVTLAAGAYNPLKHGTSAEVADRVMSVLSDSDDGGFSEPHHRIVGERWLHLAVVVLDALVSAGAQRPRGAGPWRRDLACLADLMQPPKLFAAMKNLPVGSTARTAAEDRKKELDAADDLKKSVYGLAQRVALTVERGIGHVLADTGDDGLDLEREIRSGHVVVFSLRSGANSGAAQTIANLAFQDLVATFSRLDDEKWGKRKDLRCLIPLDEFSALKGSVLEEHFARLRSQGGSLYLTSQIEADLDEVGPVFKSKVYSNSNVWLLGRQEGDDAESRAKAIGTRKTWQETRQVAEDVDALGSEAMGSGVGSLRMVDEFKIHPNELKRLRPGEQILRIGEPAALERVRVTRTRPWADLAPQDEAEPADATDDAPATDDIPSTHEGPGTEPAATADDAKASTRTAGGWDDVPDDEDW